ncbi:MAG: insulinase family protein [Actinobacteria bacterium]|nr:MAG: insulinase family protein [Actinomycetota bacterium]
MIEEHRITELDSGVRVVTERMPTVRSVALGFWIGTGSAGEAEPEAGLSHLIEHMLFRGTARFESVEIDQIFDGMGAELNAGTGKETTSVYSRVLDVHLERALDVMADMVWRPRFAQDDLDNEREIVLEEIAMYEDDPQDKVFDVLGEAVFGDHPLGRPVIGRADVIANVPVPEIAAYHDERYTGENLVIPRRAGRADPGRRGFTRQPAAAAAGHRAARRARAPHPLHPQGHRAVPPVPRRAGHPARR